MSIVNTVRLGLEAVGQFVEPSLSSLGIRLPLNPLKDDGKIDVPCLTRLLNRDLSDILGRRTSLSKMGQAGHLPADDCRFQSPQLSIAVRPTGVAMDTPTLYAIEASSQPHGSGPQRSTPQFEFDSCKVTAVRLDLRFGKEELAVRLGLDPQDLGRHRKSPIETVLDEAFVAKFGFQPNHRSIHATPEELQRCVSVISDLVADFQARCAGYKQGSQLFPRSVTAQNIALLANDNFGKVVALLSESMVARGEGFYGLAKRIQPLVIGAEREKLLCAAKLRELHHNFSTLTDTLPRFVDTNSLGYSRSTAPGFEAVATETQRCLKELVDTIKTVAATSGSMLLFAQAHSVLNQVARVFFEDTAAPAQP